MAGTWDVMWGGMPVALALRADNTATFQYKGQGGVGTWQGTWKYDDRARILYLTLDLRPEHRTYVLTFRTLQRDAGAARATQDAWSANVSMSRAKAP
jgi:hypothetical protein